MGCGQSVPARPNAAVESPQKPTPALLRAPSAPVIKIAATGDEPVLQVVPVTARVNVAAAEVTANSTDLAKARHIPVGEQVSKAAANGVIAVLELMKEHAGDAEFQWWCCDALASLSAGNEDNRAQIFVQGGLLQILAAMKLFAWDENVQTKADWALANLAASYADHCGKQGAVEAVISGMKACPDSYQVLTSGVRALQNLVAASEVNRVRAKAAGAIELLEEILEKNPEDGQLQWRGQELHKKLQTVDPTVEQKFEHEGKTEVARQSPWSKLKQAILAGQAKAISLGNVPGLFGISAQVAEAAAKGPSAVLAFMKTHSGYHDAQTWCCDALATLMMGNEPARVEVYSGGGLDLILAAMRGGLYDEELQLKCMWALLALASSFASEIGDADAIRTIVTSMYANKTAHQIQVAAVKLISLLTIEPYRKNVERANEANAVRIIKNVISAHTEDGTLQYRGVNLLERLQPGCTMEMPKQSMIRSYSMRAEEIVSQYKLSARSFVQSESRASMTPRSGEAQETTRSTHAEALSKQAIAEVDELAVAVEESEDAKDVTADADGGSRHPGSVPSSQADVRPAGATDEEEKKE